MAIYEYAGIAPALGPRVYIAPNATVIGDCTVGEETSIWFGAVLRGDVYPIRIGARSNIQDNAVVHITAGTHATTLGDEVTVGHGAIIHGCTIGNRVLIGMGSIVLDGAQVGDECLIGAGALVTPNTVIPPRSLALGQPARVVRRLSDEDVERIRESSVVYVQYAATFAAASFRQIG
jgi:carbonic anhydrase/acetyltransferase-like protein (isoleucine patch superfamily)